MATITNGKASVSPEIVLKAKRRRFSLSEKRRILQAVEAAAPGMQGAVLRREGVYFSQIATWRGQMQRGDLDVGALKAGEQQKSDAQSANRRIAELERENRKLRRRVERAELIGESQKKAAALGDELREPRDHRRRVIAVCRMLCREYSTRFVCCALGISRATLLRKPRATDACAAPRIAVRRLTEAEREAVLMLLRSPRFVDRSPGQVVAILLDEGLYLCSESTMYRLLRQSDEVRDRRRQARHPEYVKPELLATAPNQCWSWDITKLRGPHRGEWYALLVMLDIFSRMVVGWTLVRRADAKIAAEFIAGTVEAHGIAPGTLTVHADRGADDRAARRQFA